MAGAFALDLYKNWEQLHVADALPIGAGFIVAFVTAVIVVQLGARIHRPARVRAVRVVANCDRCTGAGGARRVRLNAASRFRLRET